MPRGDLRVTMFAMFMAGTITGHSCATHTAHAHGSSMEDHEAYHLGEIAETLKKIERKMK